jgi:hypothetical protein
MILDAALRLALNQAITSGTIVSQNSIDLWGPLLPSVPPPPLQPNRDIGAGRKLDLVLTTGSANFVGGTSVTPQIILGTGVDGNGVINAGTRVLSQGPALTLAQLVAGQTFVMPIPSTNPQDRGLRYLGVQFVCVGTFTVGAITADIAVDSQELNKQYGAGFTII